MSGVVASASLMQDPPIARRTPFTDRAASFIAGKFGLGLFLASLGMLFGATLIAFVVLRLQIGKHWPDLPALPRVLWFSTLAIVMSSVTMQWGLWAIRRGRNGQLRWAMLATLALGFVFVALQAVAWIEWLPPAVERWNESNEWRFALTVFYVFTCLHAAHVAGGLAPMAVVASRAMQNRYAPQEYAGVQYCAMYWHFLDVVWLLLFATMMLGV